MNQLIWFSILGAIVILPLVLIFKNELTSDLMVGVVIGVPVLGFIIHQFGRTIYEACGGWSSKRRKVIALILKKPWGITKRKTAFLVWEMTFYSSNVSDSFQSHNRNSWHYLMSFYSCTTASILSILLVLFQNVGFDCTYPKLGWPWIIVFVLMASLFIIKGRLTRKSIEAQEESLLEMHEEHFAETARRISKRNI